ncbi:MAG: hypothetical protein ACRCY3_01210 [Sphingorhabdus sp.]
MTSVDRETVLERDRTRKAARAIMREEISHAQHDLHPRTLKARWIGRQRARIAQVGDMARQKASDNAVTLGVGAAAILLFAARKPIWRLIERFQNKRRNDEDEAI